MGHHYFLVDDFFVDEIWSKHNQNLRPTKSADIGNTHEFLPRFQ